MYMRQNVSFVWTSCATAHWWSGGVPSLHKIRLHAQVWPHALCLVVSRWSSCCAYAFPGFRCSHRTKKVSQVIPWFHKKCDIIDLVFRKGGRVHHMNKSILVFWGWYFRCTYQLSPSLGVAVSQKKHLRHDHHLGIRSHPHIHWQSSVKQNPYDIPIYWLV